MKTELRLLILGAGAFLGLAFIGYVQARRSGLLPGANSFNPLSAENLAYRGANSVYAYITGNTVDTLGTALASGYSDQVGRDITAPYIIGAAPREGLAYDEFLANAQPGVLYSSPAGAIFGIPRKA